MTFDNLYTVTCYFDIPTLEHEMAVEQALEEGDIEITFDGVVTLNDRIITKGLRFDKTKEELYDEIGDLINELKR